MSEPLTAERFFDTYSRFVDTSETGPWLDRLNARYLALIHANRELLAGARVLDLACHDGRFGFAALQNGAAHVVGIDVKDHLLRTGQEHFASYGITPDRYTFLVGDMFDCLDRGAPYDVVFCFGILYHITEQLELLTRIAELNPRHVIVDTNVSALDGAVIEIRSPLGGGHPEPGSQLEGYPSKGALDAMFSMLGWTWDYFDWAASALTDHGHMQDYAQGRRVSAVVTCPDHDVPLDLRRKAVAEVLDHPHDRDRQFVGVAMVAKKFGLSPQAVRTWVHQEERRRWRAREFTL
jgi:SAM-dependent methyltransferase